jgi:hypothetical protein
MQPWDQANRRQKLGLVWRIRKIISQIINAYLYTPFFLLISSWERVSPGRSKKPGVLTAVLSRETEVLEVVDPLGVHQFERLEVLDGRASVVVGESTLERHVVVLHASTHEVSLKRKKNSYHHRLVISMNSEVTLKIR